LTLRGNDLNLTGLVVKFGTVELPVTAQTPTSVACKVNGQLLDGRLISAGSHPVSVVQILPSGKRRSSNLLIANLLPIVNSVSVSGLTHVTPAQSLSPVHGTIDINGLLLGTPEDDIFIALYRDGKTVRFFDSPTILPTSPPPPPTSLQQQLQVVLPSEQAVPQGEYRIIVRVNGQQAKNSPVINLTLP
jgi:hypothetical protein